MCKKNRPTAYVLNFFAMKGTQAYHTPIMVEQVVKELVINPEGIFLDLTFGGGGHARAILKALTKGKLWAFDQDPDALLQAKAIDDDRLTFIKGNFRFFTAFLHAYGITKMDGIFADLGVSSHQLDTPERGFAARLEGNLDMRMHQEGQTAASIVNTYTEQQLAAIFRRYGNVRNARTLAQNIVVARRKAPLQSITEFKEAIKACVPQRKDFKYYAKVFQALRMAINDEEAALHDMLLQVPNVLAPEGRFVVLTYHSGEDRPVKNFIKSGNINGKMVYDVYGNIIRPLRPVYRKPLRPIPNTNTRQRSAKMRVATLCSFSKEGVVLSL